MSTANNLIKEKCKLIDSVLSAYDEEWECDVDFSVALESHFADMVSIIEARKKKVENEAN
jgi:hypothetical protein